MKRSLTRIIGVGLVFTSISVLTACNTVQGTAEGVGQDIQNVGAAVTTPPRDMRTPRRMTHHEMMMHKKQMMHRKQMMQKKKMMMKQDMDAMHDKQMQMQDQQMQNQ